MISAYDLGLEFMKLATTWREKYRAGEIPMGGPEYRRLRQGGQMNDAYLLGKHLHGRPTTLQDLDQGHRLPETGLQGRLLKDDNDAPWLKAHVSTGEQLNPAELEAAIGKNIPLVLLGMKEGKPLGVKHLGAGLQGAAFKLPTGNVLKVTKPPDYISPQAHEKYQKFLQAIPQELTADLSPTYDLGKGWKGTIEQFAPGGQKAGLPPGGIGMKAVVNLNRRAAEHGLRIRDANLARMDNFGNIGGELKAVDRGIFVPKNMGERDAERLTGLGGQPSIGDAYAAIGARPEKYKLPSGEQGVRFPPALREYYRQLNPQVPMPGKKGPANPALGRDARLAYLTGAAVEGGGRVQRPEVYYDIKRLDAVRAVRGEAPAAAVNVPKTEGWVTRIMKKKKQQPAAAGGPPVQAAGAAKGLSKAPGLGRYALPGLAALGIGYGAYRLLGGGKKEEKKQGIPA